jgi:hypothetical protein
VLLVTLLSTAVESRRVGARPAEDDAAPQSDVEQQFKPVLIARRPLQQRVPATEVESERQPVVVVRQTPRLLQQRPREEEQDDEEPQQQVLIRQPSPKSVQQLRAQPPAQQLLQQRSNKEQQPQEQQKEPTAQTIRNFNKLNDDGSFTFGYEADDGSFKEETRGTDCVVRGKYGYVDPDGNKREFSYVQGNPCDPNAASAEDDDEQQQQQLTGGKPDEEENVPANVPRPKPKKNNNRPTTTLFQQTFGDFEQPQPQPRPQPQQSVAPRQPGRQETVRRPPPQILSPVQQQQQFADLPSSTVAPSSPQLPFRPSIGSADNLESAIRNLPQPSGKSQLVPAGPNSPLYTTELVFDPSTGQYNTVIYQQVPKQPVGININQRLPLAPARQPQPQFQPHSPPQFQSQPQPQSFQPQPQFRPSTVQPSFQRPIEFDFQRPAPSSAVQQQQLVQQQQALMFQQSQNLFRQQQKQQQQAPFQPQSTQFFPPPPSPQQSQFAPLPKQQRFEPQPEAHQQQFVLVQPGRTPGQQSLAAGQIDAFLRGHNVQF